MPSLETLSTSVTPHHCPVMPMRKTKIIATLGPASVAPERIADLIQKGVSLFRINASHSKANQIRAVVPLIRAAAHDRGLHIGILLDLQGPAIRTGDVPVPVTLDVGDRVSFHVPGDPVSSPTSFSVNYPEFARDIEVGRILLVDSGEIRMRVVGKTDTRVDCEVLNSGTMGSRRHINLPGVRVSLPALTDKDRQDVKVGLEVGVDFIAQSFVRDPDDVRELKSLLDGKNEKPIVVAKIEHQFAVDHFPAIAQAADAIMVARGDLGMECPYEELPIIQRRIVKHCLLHGRPVIVATQMLESMVNNPFPTRAEITDIANAVFEQADTIMLSGETAVGKFPSECVEVMDTISRRIERSGGANYHLSAKLEEPREMLMRSAVGLADQLNAAALVVFTRTGMLARIASWLRPRSTPIYAFSDRESLARQLAILRGVEPMVMPACQDDPAGSVEGALHRLVRGGCVKHGDSVVVVLPHPSSFDHEVESIKMHVIG